MAMGLMVFSNLETAVAAGFEQYDRKPDYWLVRTKTASGQWALAIARISKN